MRLVFTQSGWEDYLWFQENDRRLAKRINQLIRDIQRSPFSGIGKPEALKGDLSGFWSRRISGEHRLVYQIGDGDLVIVACRFHYRK